MEWSSWVGSLKMERVGINAPSGFFCISTGWTTGRCGCRVWDHSVIELYLCIHVDKDFGSRNGKKGWMLVIMRKEMTGFEARARIWREWYRGVGCLLIRMLTKGKVPGMQVEGSKEMYLHSCCKCWFSRFYQKDKDIQSGVAGELDICWVWKC